MKEKNFIEINGSKQGLFLQSENAENPVLLYLHGGPGSPEIAFAEKYPTGLEKLFTICWWEQRGSGISYNRKITPKEMTLEQMVSDTIEVTHYLRNRFGKEKIYIMGHSWGSLLGVITVKQQPEFFHAYIGIGQVAQQKRSERLAYTYMLDFVAIVLRYKGYTLGEKFKFQQGSSFSLKCLCDCMIQMDLIEQVPCLQVPVYIFQGRHDYQASYAVAKDFVTALKAPIKGFYTLHLKIPHTALVLKSPKKCAIFYKLMFCKIK